MPRRLLAFLSLLTLLPLLSGCYQVAPDSSAASQSIAPTAVHSPQPRPANTIITDGSAIVATLIKNIDSGFESFTPGYIVQIGNVGTSEGFGLFCQDKTDIQMAVRGMTQAETSDCLRQGIDYLQITIA